MLENWKQFDGRATASGLGDLLRLSPSKFCNLIWFWMTDGADPIEVQKFEAQLWTPPVGEEAKGPWSAEAEMAAFTSIQALVAQ